MSHSHLASVLVLATIAACQDTPQQEAVPGPVSVPLYSDLGTHHYAITTLVPEAQLYFDQGLRLTYAFNHAEAIRAFDEASRLDPACAMCAWGTAYAYGPNINAAMDSASGAAAWAAVQRAQELAPNGDERERALIAALAQRYADPPPTNRASLDSAYATAMAEVAARFPDDPDVAAFHAEAVMDLSPWNYWNPDRTPRAATPGVLATLERVIAENPDHPGACHYYIHAVEAVEPEKAVDCAERLADAMPGAGHLVHMPGHIYIRVGRFADAIEANEHAVHADETYIMDQQPGLGTYALGYYPHNYDFLTFAASMAGRSEQAIAAARKVESLVPAELLGTPGMGFLQQMATASLRVLDRFGRGNEIFAAPAPAEGLTYARGIWHYARGMAYTAREQFTDGAEELAQLRAAAADPAAAAIIVGYNPATAVLGIAAEVLAGRIAAGQGDLDEAIAGLRRGAEMEDALVYGEPPDWPVPVRHHLGSVLLEAGRAAEAEEAYREDLERFPSNGWSLFGLAASLRAQGRTGEASAVDRLIVIAWEGADVTLAGSSF